MKRLILAALSGAIFGAGLVISGMSDPNKVMNFLDVMGPWDPSLLVVMAVAVPVTFLGYRWVWTRTRPIEGESFQNPDGSLIDRKLLIGAALFGVGWGLAGYCPGPALTAAVITPSDGLAFVASMLIGGIGYSRVTARH